MFTVIKLIKSSMMAAHRSQQKRCKQSDLQEQRNKEQNIRAEMFYTHPSCRCAARECVCVPGVTDPTWRLSAAPSSSYTPGSWQPDVSCRLTSPHRRNKYNMIKDKAEGHKQPVSKAAVAPPAAALGRKSWEGSVTPSSVYKEMSHQKTKISLNRREMLGGWWWKQQYCRSAAGRQMLLMEAFYTQTGKLVLQELLS